MPKKLKYVGFLTKWHLVIFILLFSVIGGWVIWRSSAVNPNSAGDENSDGVVNITDLSILLSNWGSTTSAYDLNGDGLVNITDLSILLSHWGGTSSSGSSFIQVCGTQLCLNSQPYVIHGATAYGQYDNAANEVALAKQANINLLEIVEFETQYHTLGDTMSEPTWTRVDKFIAAAKNSGLHVILNLSSYGQSLMAAGIKPTTYDWNSYLSFIANRTNTVTGIQYKNDPTIAMVELYGEIDAPNYSTPLRGTTAETTAFFKRTMAEWRTLDANHLVSTGGFSYINDPSSGIDWQTIVSDPNNATCDVEINSYPDRNTSVPDMSSYCHQLGKPWFLAAWSSCYRQSPGFGGDINSWSTDTDMASHAQDMYNISKNNNPVAPGPAMAGIGNDFWNLASNTVYWGTCDIGPQFPLIFNIVQSN